MQWSAKPSRDPVTPVSSDADLLILVDSADNPVGHLDKARCHDAGGILHRAFSLFIFNSRGELLLQQRALGKRLWPGYWSNSCCSHPRVGESMEVAIGRRLAEELSLETTLSFIYKFEYQARFGDAGSEHELCSVYIGFTDQEPSAHPEEIAAWRWASTEVLERELANAPGSFTPWFRLEWQALQRDHAHRLRSPTPGRPC